jgi:hypothetical protein
MSKPHHNLMMLCNPMEHEFISMNPMFHLSIPAYNKESSYSL